MEFGVKFIDFDLMHRADRDYLAAEVILKRSMMSLSMLAYCRLYEDLLTPYAWKFVKDQLSAIEFVKIKEQYLDGTLVTNSRRGNNVVFTTHCSCIESRSLVLPCRHIFKCHQMRHLPLF